MHKSKAKINKIIKKYVYGKYTFLLFSIILMILIMPVVTELVANFVYDIFILLVLVGSILSLSRNSKLGAASIILGIISFISIILNIFFPDNDMVNLIVIAQPMFFLLSIVLILKDLIHSRKVNYDLLMGSICVYFLLGFLSVYFLHCWRVFIPVHL